MKRASAIALCGALLALSSSAGAQIAVEERLRLQGGYITEARPRPAERLNDVWIGAMPELVLSWQNDNVLFNASYSLIGTLHSFAGLSEIANRAVLGASIDLSRRATLLLFADAAQTTLSNLLISTPVATSTVGLLPGSNNRILTAGVHEALRYELGPRDQLTQTADASIFTSLPGSPPIDTFFGTTGLGVEHVWPKDGVGGEVRGGYTNLRIGPPLFVQQFITVSAGPYWRHDWTNALSTFLHCGAVVLFSPDEGTRPVVGPSARASALYTYGPTTFDLAYTTGIFPSPLTGQMIQSHQAMVHVLTPVDEHRGIYIGGGGGYLNASLVNLRDRASSIDFDNVFADVELTWRATPLAHVFARYQFVAQIGEVSTTGVNPSFLRDVFLVGVQFSSRPPTEAGAAGGGGTVYGTVPRRFPQRVDQSDGAQRRTDEDPNVIRGTTPGQQNPPSPPAGTERGPTRWIHTTPNLPPREEERR